MSAKKMHGLCFGLGDPPEKTRANIRKFMMRIEPYCSWIRTYDSRAKTRVTSGIARDLGLKVAAGAWLDADPRRNERDMDDIVVAARKGLVDMAIIGNETLLRRELSDEQLANYIKRFKHLMPHIPVTTGDASCRLIESPEVLAACDIIGMHHYPYWSGISIDDAIPDFGRRYDELAAHAAGKEIMVLETGWPSDGNTIKNAVASLENARRYFCEIHEWARRREVKVFYFEAFDEKWKAQHEGPQGAHWGIWHSDGTQKIRW